MSTGMGASMMGTGERTEDMDKALSSGRVVLLISVSSGTIAGMARAG